MLSSLGLRLLAPCAAQPQPQLSLDLEVASSALLDLHKKTVFLQSVVKTLCYLYGLSLYLQLSIATNMNHVLKPHLPGLRGCKTKKALLSLFLNTLFWDLWDLLQTRISSQTNKICSKARLCQLWGSQFQCWDPWSYLIWFFMRKSIVRLI